VNGGSEDIIGLTGASGVLLDNMTILGHPHSYRAYAFTSDGRVSVKSAPVTTTPEDILPPSPPRIQVVPVANGINVAVNDCREYWTEGSPGEFVGGQVLVNIYFSSSAGGPYTQANPLPMHPGGASEMTIPSLQNGRTYYVVGTAVDPAGNESEFSEEIAVTVGP
jgi:hypothetical protein